MFTCIFIYFTKFGIISKIWHLLTNFWNFWCMFIKADKYPIFKSKHVDVMKPISGVKEQRDGRKKDHRPLVHFRYDRLKIPSLGVPHCGAVCRVQRPNGLGKVVVAHGSLGIGVNLHHFSQKKVNFRKVPKSHLIFAQNVEHQAKLNRDSDDLQQAAQYPDSGGRDCVRWGFYVVLGRWEA